MSIAMTPAAWLAGVALMTASVGVGVQLSGSASGAGGGSASAAKADFTIAAQPGSTTIQQGKSGTYTVTVAAVGGFAGSVSLSASATPSGVSGTLTPSSLTLGSASQATSTFSISVAKTAPLGSYTLTLTGTYGSGKGAIAHSTAVGLTVQRQAGSLSVTVTPSPLTLDPGSRGTYNVTLDRTGAAVGALAALTLTGTLPSGTTTTFASPNPTTGTSSALEISTAASSPTGTYALSINATAGDYSATTPVSLVLAASAGRAFVISDPSPAVAGLAPGLPARALDLRISNPNGQQLAITNLTVSVNQPIGATCTQANFAVTQIPSGYPILLPANASSVSLTSLGLTTSQLPTLQLRDLSSNQEACKRTTVTLAYAGSGNSN